jgi:AcrR family transcriptional regulator
VAGERDPAFDDLTARARIREAAMEQFAERGFDATTIRGIAAAAGVSPGLLRHHYGSKAELRDAVDAHVLAEIRRVSDEVLDDVERGSLFRAAMTREALRPYRTYLTRALLDGSPFIGPLFEEMVEYSQRSVEQADERRTDPPMADSRTRGAVLTAMSLGIPLLRQHLSRVLGADIFSEEGERLLALASLDLFAHPLITPELAESARAGYESATAPSIDSSNRSDR